MRSRGKTRKSLTVDLSDQVEYPSADELQLGQKKNGGSIAPSSQLEVPAASQKRKRNRKSGGGDSLLADAQDGFTPNGDTGALDNNGDIAPSRSQKRRKLRLSQAQNTENSPENDEQPLQAPNHDAMDVDEEPILVSNLLLKLKAKEAAKLAKTSGSAEQADASTPTESPVADEEVAQESPRKKQKTKKRQSKVSASEAVQDTGETEGPPANTEPLEDDVAPPENKKKKRKRQSKVAESEEIAQPDDLVHSGGWTSINEIIEPEVAETQIDEDTPPDAETPKSSKATESAKTPKSAKSPKTAKTPKSDAKPKKNAGGSSKPAVGAEAELAIVHKLPKTPHVRDEGDFTEDEAELIREKIRQYQHRHDLNISDLVGLIQWTHTYAGSKDSGPNGESMLEERQRKCAAEFWREIYEVLPRRRTHKAKGGTSSIQRFVRRRYHNYKGGGGWTAEEDEMLEELSRAHPAQWKKISQIMGDRSDMAIRDRWRNYIQCGGRNTDRWTNAEEAALNRAVVEVIDKLKADRKAVGRPPIAEYRSGDINWQAVSEKVGSRSRLQCVQKWKTLHVKDGASASDITPAATPKADRSSKTKKARKSLGRKARQASPDVVDEDNQAENGETNPEPKKSRASKPGYRNMRWGDKLDVILALSECAFDTEEEIDWAAVAAKSPDSPWSTKARKAVLKELLEVVGAHDSLATALDAICEHLQEQYGEELEEHWEPGMDADGDVGKENADVNGEKGKSKRKRKSVGANQGRKMKSSEMITASDDEL